MSDKKYNTMVFKGVPEGNFFTEKFIGMECVAWSRGHVLDEREQLEDFIRNLACGEIESPEEQAEELMDQMGWS